MSKTIKQRWQPNKGREISDIVNRLNEIYDAVNSNTIVGANSKKFQNITTVKKDDGTHAVQIRTEEGIIESDPTSPTGFRKI